MAGWLAGWIGGRLLPAQYFMMTWAAGLFYYEKSWILVHARARHERKPLILCPGPSSHILPGLDMLEEDKIAGQSRGQKDITDM
jgi:hypothetical protein